MLRKAFGALGIVIVVAVLLIVAGGTYYYFYQHSQTRSEQARIKFECLKKDCEAAAQKNNPFNIFFASSSPESQMNIFVSKISTLSDVAGVTFVSQEEARSEMAARYTDPEIKKNISDASLDSFYPGVVVQFKNIPEGSPAVDQFKIEAQNLGLKITDISDFEATLKGFNYTEELQMGSTSENFLNTCIESVKLRNS